jgi:hypothetical protein
MKKLLPLFVAASLLVGVSPSVLAQPLDKDADAERLFREGQKLMEERRYGEACPKFEAAYRKDQQLGTLLNLAYCHKEQGAVWQAWLEFKEAEVKAIELKRTDRKEFAKQRMTELEKSLAKGVVEVQQKIDLTEVLVEDRRVPEAEKGQVFAIEPGQRKFTFRAKGKKQLVTLVTISKSSQPQRITVPEMEEQPKEAPIPETPPQKPVEKPQPPPPPPPDTGWSPLKTAGLVAAGVGLVGGGALGTIFGLKASNSKCAPGPPPCNAEEREEAGLDSAISTASFIGGSALLVGGLALFIFAPSGKATAASSSSSLAPGIVPQIGAGYAGLHGVF